jgi:hypothetical protein
MNSNYDYTKNPVYTSWLRFITEHQNDPDAIVKEILEAQDELLVLERESR